MRFFVLLFTLLPIIVLGQSNDHALWEKEIVSLSSTEEIRQYWKQIHKDDQANRGKNVIDSIDNVNFKRMLLMIKYHGYPESTAEDRFFTPNIIFTHQSSRYVREHYFPVLLDAYKKGKADTWWFLHNVKGLFRSRFDRDLYVKMREGHVEEVLTWMEPFVNKEIDMDITVLDALYEKKEQEAGEILKGEVLYVWKQKVSAIWNIHYKLISKGDKYYLLLLYWDGAYHIPQEVLFDQDARKLTYKVKVHDEYFLIDDKNRLTKFRGGQPVFKIKHVRRIK